MIATGLDATLAALADPTRRRVVDLLRHRPRRPSDLAMDCEVSPPAMSRHLRVLRKRGLIEEDRLEEDARVRLYRLRRPPFDELEAWIEQVRAFWTDQLEAFKQHAERNPEGESR